MFVCMFVPRISPKRNALAISKILHNILMPILGQRYCFQVAILFKRRNMGRIHFPRYFEVISITYRRQKREAAANTLVPQRPSTDTLVPRRPSTAIYAFADARKVRTES